MAILWLTFSIKHFIFCCLVLLNYYPSTFYSFIINSIIIFVLIAPLKKIIKKDLTNAMFLPCGGMVSLFKSYGNNFNEFTIMLMNLPVSQAIALLEQDKLFLENKNNSWEIRSALLKEGLQLEDYILKLPKNSIVKDNWLTSVNSANAGLKDLSGNQQFFNLLLEKEVVTGSTALVQSLGIPIVHFQNNIPKNFKAQLFYTNPKKSKELLPMTPDFLAIHLKTIQLTSYNMYDVKRLNLETLTEKSELSVKLSKDPNNYYNLIHHGLTSNENFIKTFYKVRFSVNPGTLFYCSKLETVLRYQCEKSPITQTDIPGLYNFGHKIFKTFKDTIIP
jgi:hypothetical protein